MHEVLWWYTSSIMEPTKNPINNGGQTTGTGGNNSDPIFQGMPKPGQPLASTPKFSIPTSPSTPTPSHSVVPPSPFSAHAPSALDRIMNPNIDKTPSVASSTSAPVVPPVNAIPTPSHSIPTPVTASSSSFKPYTPPTQPVAPQTNQVHSASVPYTGQSTNSQSNMVHPTMSQPTMSSASVSNTAYKTTTPPVAPATMMPKNSALIADGMVPTTGALKPSGASGSHKSTIVLIISAIVVLLLLGGGAYYWYTTMATPSADVENSDQNSSAQNPNSSNKPVSSFPTAVTSRPTNTSTSSPVMMQNNQSFKPATQPTTKPAAPTKVTRVTTPFTQSQRSIVSSYIETNINSFAIPKSRTSYEVIDVTFDGPDRALVQYTNGTASYTAIAVASIDTANNVRILSFSLLEK